MTTMKMKVQRGLSLLLVLLMLETLLFPFQAGATEWESDQGLLLDENSTLIEEEDTESETDTVEEPTVNEEVSEEVENETPVVEEQLPEEEAVDAEQLLEEQIEIENLVTPAKNSAEIREQVEQSIERTKQYYKDIQPKGSTFHSDYWLFSALWGADVNLETFPWRENGRPWDKDSFWTKGLEEATKTSNEDAGIIIGSILLEQDPQKFGQRNIVQDLIDKQKEDGSFFTIWGESWALIALDLVDANYDRDKHIEYILEKQNAAGTFGGVDANGWMLTALAPYMDTRSDVKEAIEKAVQSVHEGYQTTGDISDSWGANSNSSAAALMGLAAVGEDLLSAKWTKDGKNVVEQFIETYQQEDGSFWWQENMAGAVGIATEQSLLALATIVKEESIFVQLKEQKKDSEEPITIEQSIEKTKQYYKDIQPKGSTFHSDYWLFSALWGADVNLETFPWRENGRPWDKDSFWTKGLEEATKTSNEDAGIIIGSILLEQDPQKFGQRNIVQDLIDKQKEDGSFFTIWGESWAMIALDLVDADYDRNKHIEYILGKQNAAGTFGDVDANGWMLTALAPYMDTRSDVKEAIEKAVQSVHEGYQTTGDISSSWGANSNSTAAALMGLAAVGEDLQSDKWTKNGKNIVEQFIETYQQENGSFWWQENMAGAVGMATEQSLLALATIAKEESIFVQLKEQRKDAEEQLTKVSMRVEGIHETLYFEDALQVVTSGSEATAFDATKQGLDQAGISFEGSSSFISKIGDEDTATFGGWDGWHYMVNDDYPSVGVGEYRVKDGDQIVWFYGNVGDIYKGELSANEVEKLTLDPQIHVATELYAGDEIEVSVTAEYNVYNESFELEEKNVKTPIKQATVHFAGEMYKTDDNGIARIPGEKAQAGAYEIKVTKDIEGSYPRLLRQAKKVIVDEKPETPEKAVTVSLRVEGINKTLYVEDALQVVTSGSEVTAFDATKQGLDQAGISFEAPNGYINKIAGEESGAFGVWDGWQYLINNSSPDVGAGDYLVKDGDEIVWFYGNSGDITKGQEAVSDVDKLTLNPQIHVATESYAGEEIEVSVTAKYNVYNENFELEQENVETPIKQATVQFAGEMYQTDDKGIVRLPGEKVKVGTYEIQVSKDIEDSYPRLLRQAKKIIIEDKPSSGGGGGGGGGGSVQPSEKTVTLSIEKRSIGQGDILKPVKVTLQSGDTAFTLLERVAKKEKISVKSTGSGSQLYVQAIDGLGEFDEGPLSGWMYSVNGVFPEYSAGSYTLKDGDDLRWQYTKNLGEDIGGTEGSGGGSAGGSTGSGSSGNTSSQGTNKEEEKSSATLKKSIDDAANWINKHRDFTKYDSFNDWDAIGLARSGKQVPAAYYASLESFVKEKNGEFRLVTDYERIVLAVTAIGKDPQNIAGYHFIEKIYTNPRMTNQGTNGIVFALLALDSKNYEVPTNALWTREKLVNELLKQQNTDGGFPLATGAASDIDMTAMALQALANYQDVKEVKAATDQAIAWLSTQQRANGGFYSAGSENSESISQVVIALSSLGIDLDDKRFTKDKGNLQKALLSFVNADGGLSHTKGDESDYMATQQGLMALAAYQRASNKENSLYQMTDVTIPTENEKPVVLFSDVPENAFGQKEIEELVQLGVIQGYPDGTFKPNQNLIRGQAATLFVRALDLESPETTVVFKDVTPSSSYFASAQAVKAAGIFNGKENGTFGATDLLTREQMATVLVRAFDLKATNDKVDLTDLDVVSASHRKNVEILYQNGITTGRANGTFDPKAPVTRAQFAIFLSRAMNNQVDK